MLKRVGLFILSNFAVMIVLGFVLSLLGVRGESLTGLLVMSLLFGFGGSFISLLLSKRTALYSVGGMVITQPKNETERWLVNTIRRLADGANIKMPEVAIYQAPDMNAFATGPRRNNSLVAVSTGLLENMNRDEIEAVLAHEITHITNGDMITMVLLQGILNTFVIFLSRLISRLVYQLYDERESVMIYYVLTFVLEIVFGILASIIAMWFSRQREFAADSGSASLVGADKMIKALKRLQMSYEPEETQTVQAFCINGRRENKFSELFMSHPPLVKRIEALQKHNAIIR